MKLRTCPDCGANLDPGEICDCRNVPQDANAENKKATMPASIAATPEKELTQQ